MFSSVFSSSKKGKKDSSAEASATDTDGDSALNEWFNGLKDTDDDSRLYMEGISGLCEQLGMDPCADVRVLVMMWRLNATSKPGSISRAEFVEGMKKEFRVTSADQMKGRLAGLDPGFLENSEFRDFFHFAFQFSREGTHKTIEKDMILSLLPMVVDKNRAPHLDFFLEFLGQCTTHSVINLDQWNSFLTFQSTDVDLKNYDDNGAWPILLDEYVDWRRENMGRK